MCMSNEHWSKKLESMGACVDVVDWASEYPSWEVAWDSCERADWLLWFSIKLADRKLVVLAACACARTTLHLVPKGEERPRLAIETAEAWTRGEATIDEVRDATTRAHYAAHYFSREHYDAAYYAAVAAYNAALSCHTAYYAASADAYYAASALGTTASIARHDAHLSMCKIIRSIISIPELT